MKKNKKSLEEIIMEFMLNKHKADVLHEHIQIEFDKIEWELEEPNYFGEYNLKNLYSREQ